MALTIATPATTALCDALVDLLDAGTIQIRSGTRPAGPDTAATGTLLATITLANPAFGDSVDGVAVLFDPPPAVAVADGIATWFRAYRANQAAVCDGSVTATGGGGDLTLGTTSITTGLTVDIAGGTITVQSTGIGTQSQAPLALVAIDGEYITGTTQSNFVGDGYFTRKGFTRAATFTGTHPLGGTYNGFDDPNFLIIGNANTDPGGLSPSNSAYLDVMRDAGLTIGLPTSGAVSASDFAAKNMACTVTIEPSTYPTPSDIPSDARAAVMGVIAGEEPWDTAGFQSIIDTANTWLAQDTDGGRFQHTGFFDNILNGDIDYTYTPRDMTLPFDVFTCDSYWFAGAWDNGDPSQISLARYNLRGRLYMNWFNAQGEPVGTYRSVDETARGCHYGSQNDSIRKWWNSGESRPMGQWVETGAPYTEASSNSITPPRLKWAMWSTAVHGSRIFPLFDHSFRPDHITASTLNDPFYGFAAVGGANTGIYVATQTMNRQLLTLAQVINSPKDGYFAWGDDAEIVEAGFLTAVTSTNPRHPFAGVDAVCKWHPVEETHYILASSRESEAAVNIPVTFRMVDQGQTSATELFSGRTLALTRGGTVPAGFCELTDTFADAATPLAYRIETDGQAPMSIAFGTLSGAVRVVGTLDGVLSSQ